MKLGSCFYLLISLVLQGQSGPVREWGADWWVVDEAVVTRSEVAPHFQKAEGIPPLPLDNSSRWIGRTFDGERLYQVENPAAKVFRLRCAEIVAQQDGAVWWWFPPIPLKDEDLHFLAAAAGRFLVGVRGVKDGGGQAVYRVDVIEWPSGNRRTLLEVQDPQRDLQGAAMAVDGEFFLFLTNGTLYRIDPAAASHRLLESNIFGRLCSRFTDSVVPREQGASRVPQPPSFLSPPFASTSGEIFIPARIRERNRYPESTVRRMFSAMPVEEQHRLIESGRWPLKPEAFEGSEYVALMLRYDPATRTLAAVPHQRLGGLVREMPETEQWLWAGGTLPPLAMDALGQIQPLRTFTPSDKREAAPATPSVHP